MPLLGNSSFFIFVVDSIHLFRALLFSSFPFGLKANVSQPSQRNCREHQGRPRAAEDANICTGQQQSPPSSPPCARRRPFQRNKPRQIVTRVAPTFLRFGSFEIFKARDGSTGRQGSSYGNDALRKRMLDYAIRRFFPGAEAAGPEGSKARYLAM